MSTFHIVQGGIDNGDFDWLKQATPKTVSSSWVVPKTAQIGDPVAIYVPSQGIIGIANLVDAPEPRKDWYRRYGARLTGFRLLREPIRLDDLREQLPGFEWARYPRSITTPAPHVAVRISRLISRRFRDRRWPKEQADIAQEIDAARAQLAGLDATTRAALIQARLGQGIFRARVSNYWKSTCALTRVTVLPALRASHIKPWRDSSNEERLDAFNGLLLAGTADLLFDAGLISFADDGRILFARELKHREQVTLGLSSKLRLHAVHPRHHPYLRWHRERVFAGVA